MPGPFHRKAGFTFWRSFFEPSFFIPIGFKRKRSNACSVLILFVSAQKTPKSQVSSPTSQRKTSASFLASYIAYISTFSFFQQQLYLYHTYKNTNINIIINMVMHVEVYHEDSFLSNSFNMPNDENVQVILVENGDTSMRSIGRDTSNTCRNVSLDNTRDNSRQTVNTEHSILDLTKEEEEDDEDDEYEADRSVLFQDLHSPMPNEEEEEVSLNKHSLLGKFSLNKVTDTFVDSLCRATSGSCAVPSSCSQPCAVPNSLSCVPQQRLQIGTDVWNLLGCSAHPGDVEMDSIWQLKTKDVFQKRRKPVRSSITSRMQRIRRLRAQRWSGATRYGVTIASTAPAVSRAHTMDDPLADMIGQGMDPIPHDDGYDSDPEFGRTPAPPTIIPEDEEMEAPADVDEQDHIIHQTVQVRGWHIDILAYVMGYSCVLQQLGLTVFHFLSFFFLSKR